MSNPLSPLAMLATSMQTQPGVYALLLGSGVSTGAGAGFLLVPAINLVVGSAPEAQSGVASGIQQATQQLGGTLGIAVFGSIISSIVAQTFAHAVRATNAPADLAADLGGDGGLHESIALGFPAGAQEQLREQLGDPLAGEVIQAAHLTFLNALDTVFTVAIVTVLAAAVLSLFIKTPRTKQPAGA
ncbi:MAG: hypothetical protein L0G99_11385 [Propionibacteriales bacterium]|nr:hypothetical protein [Propionibacteriales bacterium]